MGFLAQMESFLRLSETKRKGFYQLILSSQTCFTLRRDRSMIYELLAPELKKKSEWLVQTWLLTFIENAAICSFDLHLGLSQPEWRSVFASTGNLSAWMFLHVQSSDTGFGRSQLLMMNKINYMERTKKKSKRKNKTKCWKTLSHPCPKKLNHCEAAYKVNKNSNRKTFQKSSSL